MYQSYIKEMGMVDAFRAMHPMYTMLTGSQEIGNNVRLTVPAVLNLNNWLHDGYERDGYRK